MTNQRPGQVVPPPRGSQRSPAPVEQRVCAARDSLPGQRDALPECALDGVPPDPQGDENRDAPPKAPTPPP
jgi:hypothetical protein